MPLIINKEKADAKYWDNIWENLYKREDYNKPLDGFLLKYFIKYLPKKGKILEGGAGLGRWVYYLSGLGYDITGLDFAEKIVTKLNEIFPNLKIKQGDILSVKAPDNYYSAYLSLGVLEHFFAGPDRALIEAKRILVPGGILIITVPYFNPLRQLKKFFGYYQNNQTGEFYQYLYARKEFAEILKKYNFKILKTSYFGSYKGIKDEILKKTGRKIYKKLKSETRDRTDRGGLFKFVYKLINFFPVRFFLGHTMVIVCQNIK